jgi:hypothetical protein
MQLQGHTVHHLKDCNLYSYSTYTVVMKTLQEHEIKCKYQRRANTGIYSIQDKQPKMIKQSSSSLFDFKNSSYIPRYYSYTPRSHVSKCTVLICKLWGFHSSVNEVSSLPGRDAAWFGGMFLTFQRNVWLSVWRVKWTTENSSKHQYPLTQQYSITSQETKILNNNFVSHKKWKMT